MTESKRSKIVGLFSVALITLTLITLGFSPDLAAAVPQGMQSMPGAQVILRLDDRYNPYHVPPPEQAELSIQSVNFTINWNPGTCTGTTSPWTQPAKDAFNYAVGIWASLLNSSQTIEVDACWRSDLGPSVLGSCGPTTIHRDFTNAPVANTWYPVALANALANSDLNAGTAEVEANLSSTFTWYYGTDGNTPPTQVDFVSVVLHELGHGVGFIGSMLVDNGSGFPECNGVNGFGCWGWGTAYPFIYDRFAEDGSNTSLLNYTNPSAALGSALTGNVGGGVFFDGPNANAANGGSRVKLYAPNPWNPGSSYSHLDEIFNNTPNALMTYSLAYGESEHHPGPVTLGMFQDMGWSVSGGCGDTYESDDTFNNAKTITVNGAVQHHNFHEDGDEDWAKFTVTASETYTITTSNLGASNDTYLYLYDTNGTTLLTSNDDCPGGGGASCINNWSDPDSGTYFIKVRNYDNQGDCTGYDYDLRVVDSRWGVEAYLPIIFGKSQW